MFQLRGPKGCSVPAVAPKNWLPASHGATEFKSTSGLCVQIPRSAFAGEFMGNSRFANSSGLPAISVSHSPSVLSVLVPSHPRHPGSATIGALSGRRLMPGTGHLRDSCACPEPHRGTKDALLTNVAFINIHLRSSELAVKSILFNKQPTCLLINLQENILPTNGKCHLQEAELLQV